MSWKVLAVHGVLEGGGLDRETYGGDIADDGELAVWGLEGFKVDEVGDLAGQVDAVDKDVAVGDLLCGGTNVRNPNCVSVTKRERRTKRTAFGSLSHVPLENLVIGDAGLLKGGDSAGAATAEGTDDDDLGHPSSLLDTLLNSSLDVGDQSGLIWVA